MIDVTSGNPFWILGGRRNQFSVASGSNRTTFLYQSDARYSLSNTSQITMFDNHGLVTGPCSSPECSRAIQLELDFKQKHVRLLEEHFHPQLTTSGEDGSVQRLSNGNLLVNWGSNPALTEYLPNGSLVMDIQKAPLPNFKGSVVNSDLSIYRAWKMNWVGRPPWVPHIAVVAEAGSGRKTAYLSWNGATEVDTWRMVCYSLRSR